MVVAREGAEGEEGIMTAPWIATILTLFPEMFPGALGHSIPGRACQGRHLGTGDGTDPRFRHRQA